MSTPKTIHFLYVGLTLCLLLIAAEGENSTTVKPDTVKSENDPIDLALAPLYKMTNTFIEVVFPNGIRFDTINSVTKMIEKGPVDAWPLAQTILNGYYGYATCVVLGLLLVVLMPFIGCFCCCCRICNKCGGKTSKNDPKNGKCKRMVCSGLLLIFVLITVGGMVMVFFSSARLYELVNKDIIGKELRKELNGLNEAAKQTVSQDVVAKTEETLDKLNKTVFEFLDEASNDLTANLLNISHVKKPVDNLAIALNNFNSSLDNLIEAMTKYELTRNETANNFTTAQNLINATMISQAATPVEVLVSTINKFSVQDVIDELNSTAKTALNKIPNFSDAFIEVNTSIANFIERKFNSSKADIKKVIDDATSDIRTKLNSTSKFVLEPLRDITEQGKTFSADIQDSRKFAQYGWYGFLALGAFIAFITLLYLVGLMCGCGERPHPDANICNKGCGANFILAAVGFTFIFFSLLILITCIMFALGSLTTSHVCWAIQKPNETLNALKDNEIVLPIEFQDSSLKLSALLQPYRDCLDMKPIESLIENFGGNLNKQALLDEINKKLNTSSFEKIINNINISANGFDFLTSDFNDTLQRLYTYDAFNSSIVEKLEPKVEDIKAKLNTSIIAVKLAVQITTNQMEKRDLNRSIEIFEHARDYGIGELLTYANETEAVLKEVNLSLEVLKNASSYALKEIGKAQDDLKVNGTDAIKKALRKLMDDLVSMVKSQAFDGISQVFNTKCDKLANSLKSTANVVCKTTLNPFNGLWFSFGWCMIMLIPCIIIALFVSNLFRRSMPYDGDYKEDLNNRDYDIPLESMRKPNYHGDNRANPGFRDDYGKAMNRGGYDRYQNANHMDQSPPNYYR